MTFYERYEKCCKENGIAPMSQFAADKLGCTKSSISAFAKSGKAPQGSIVANASKMLNVSADYLLDIIDVPKPINIDFTQNELNLLSDIKELNTETQKLLHSMIKGILNQNEDIKKPAD